MVRGTTGRKPPKKVASRVPPSPPPRSTPPRLFNPPWDLPEYSADREVEKNVVEMECLWPVLKTDGEQVERLWGEEPEAKKPKSSQNTHPESSLPGQSGAHCHRVDASNKGAHPDLSSSPVPTSSMMYQANHSGKSLQRNQNPRDKLTKSTWVLCARKSLT